MFTFTTDTILCLFVTVIVAVAVANCFCPSRFDKSARNGQHSATTETNDKKAEKEEE